MTLEAAYTSSIRVKTRAFSRTNHESSINHDTRALSGLFLTFGEVGISVSLMIFSSFDFDSRDIYIYIYCYLDTFKTLINVCEKYLWTHISHPYTWKKSQKINIVFPSLNSRLDALRTRLQASSRRLSYFTRIDSVSATYRPSRLTSRTTKGQKVNMCDRVKLTLGCAMNALAAPGNSACWATVAAVFSHNVSKRASTLHNTFKHCCSAI